MELFWILIMVVVVTQIYTCVKTHEMYTKNGKSFCKFFTKTILKKQIQTLEGRIVLSSNKSLGSILIFSLLQLWRIYLSADRSFRGQIHFLNQVKTMA